MKKFDILIIGGGPAGVSCAISSKNTYPDKEVALIRRETNPMIPCGIPYTMNTLKNVEDNILPDAPLKANNITVFKDEVIEGTPNQILLASGEKISCDKMVLATGSEPVLPKIEGIEKEGVFQVKKEIEYLKVLKEKVNKASNVVILGGGYIGIEFADEIAKMGKNITILEIADTLLPTMDKEFTFNIMRILSEEKVKILTGKKIKKIKGNGVINSVELSDGSNLDCDLLLVSIGCKPNIFLAEKLGLEFKEGKGIIVDDYLRTSNKNIFAIGDCAAKYDYFTGEFSSIMLASTAMAEGRLVGSNIYSIKVIRKYQGVLGTFSTKIGNTAFAVSGITENQAKNVGMDYTVGMVKVKDRHPAVLPDASEMMVKLIFSTYSHNILGSQVMGGNSVGELINMLSVMILNKMTDMDIDTMQIGTHPLLTASPIAYPVINATVDAIKKWYKPKIN
jgi:pyruvate/2-oxoglutarate dehydrogenase complex dihydrolipoamide dehydrogenase (E3) component